MNKCNSRMSEFILMPLECADEEDSAVTMEIGAMASDQDFECLMPVVEFAECETS